jgi:hypothetical protein
MAPIVVVAYEIQDTSDSTVWNYRAYSSNDPGRSASKLKRDVFQFVGYQECNPEDCMTPFGKLRHFYVTDCGATLGDRSQGIYCVRLESHDFNEEHSVVARDNRDRLVDEDADEELIMECQHMTVPEVNMGAEDEEGGNGSDSGSDTSE